MNTEIRELNDAELKQVSGGSMFDIKSASFADLITVAVKVGTIAGQALAGGKGGAGPAGGGQGGAGPVPA